MKNRDKNNNDFSASLPSLENQKKIDKKDIDKENLKRIQEQQNQQ